MHDDAPQIERRLHRLAFVALLGVVLGWSALGLWAAQRVDLPYAAWAWGASSASLSWREPWRLVTSGWLHLSPRHLLLNCVGLSALALGLGTARSLWIFALGAFCGAVASASWQTSWSSGASGGLVALFVVAASRLRAPSPHPLLGPSVLCIGLGLAWITLMGQGVDHASHLGGGLVGLSVALWRPSPRADALGDALTLLTWGLAATLWALAPFGALELPELHLPGFSPSPATGSCEQAWSDGLVTLCRWRRAEPPREALTALAAELGCAPLSLSDEELQARPLEGRGWLFARATADGRGATGIMATSPSRHLEARWASMRREITGR